MSKYKLAPVRWYMGQTLLPEHFVAQQGVLGAELRLRTELLGLPAYGIARLVWNETSLAKGVLSISSLTVLMPEGTLLDIPGAGVINDLLLKLGGTSRITVYLHLLSETLPASANDLYSDDPKVLQRVIFKYQLSLEESLDRSLGSVRLAELESLAGTWQLSRAYIPPLLQVGPNPFLRVLLAELKLALEAFRPQLQTQITDSFYRTDRIAAVRRCLVAVCRVESLLSDIANGVHQHPYHLFEALRTLYLEVCCFHEIVPERPVLTYKHDALVESLGWLGEFLKSKLRATGGRETHAKFAKRDGLFTLSPLPPEVMPAQEVYLLIRRPVVHERIALEGVKLASPSRLPLVHRLALKGVPFKHQPQPPFNHSFGAEIDFYVLTLGEEWEQVTREGAIAFYITPSTEKADAFLYWRHG